MVCVVCVFIVFVMCVCEMVDEVMMDVKVYVMMDDIVGWK